MTNEHSDDRRRGDRRARVASIVEHIIARDSALLDALAAGEDRRGPRAVAPTDQH